MAREKLAAMQKVLANASRKEQEQTMIRPQGEPPGRRHSSPLRENP